MSKEQSEELIHIEAIQILGKYCGRDIQIFFQEKRDPLTNQPIRVKEPVTLFINNSGAFNEYPVECIEKVIVKFTQEPNSILICDSKCKTELFFKVLLLVKFQDTDSFELITLPDDIGINCTTLYDLTQKQVANSLYQTMQIVGGSFVYTITIPFEDFTPPIPPVGFANLLANMIASNMEWSAEVGEVTFDGTGSPPVPATRVDLAITYNLLNQIGIEQEIIVSGTVE